MRPVCVSCGVVWCGVVRQAEAVGQGPDLDRGVLLLAEPRTAGTPVRPTTTAELPWLNGVITPNNQITVYHGTAFFNFAHNSVIFSQY